jgi:hypothetical protein
MSLPHEPDQIATLEAEKCAGCGADLQGVGGHVINTRYKLEMPHHRSIEIVATEQGRNQLCHVRNEVRTDRGTVENYESFARRQVMSLPNS